MEDSKDLTNKEYIQINQSIFSLRNFYESRLRKEVHGHRPDLTAAEIGLLMVVGQFGKVTSKKLSQMMDITPATVSQYVRKLRNRELFYQVQDNNDRRLWWLSLTDKGQCMYEDAVEGAVRYTKEMLTILPREDRQILHRLLLNLSHNHGYDWQ